MNLINYLVLTVALLLCIQMYGQNDDLYYIPSKHKDSLTIQKEEPRKIQDSTIDKRKGSIHIFPNFINNYYAINFEYLILNKVSFLVETRYSFEPDDFKEYGLHFNYRIRNKPTLNSLFYGFFADFTACKYDYYLDTSYEIEHIAYDYKKLIIGANIGRKWIFKCGLGIEIMAGWGYPFENIHNKSRFEIESNSLVYDGIVSSLSFGYSF